MNNSHGSLKIDLQMRVYLSWLESSSDKADVDGSIPSTRTNKWFCGTFVNTGIGGGLRILK